MKYVAFLRGVNVGGNRKVPIGDLRDSFASLDFGSVKTLLNSGNVVFQSDETNISHLESKIEEELEKKFGWQIATIIRSQKDLQEIVDADPFKSITVTPQT